MRWRQQEGWAMLTTVVLLVMGMLVVSTVASAWWTGYRNTVVTRAALAKVYQSQASVDAAAHQLETDPAATKLNTSVPIIEVAVPPPDNAPVSKDQVYLDDPISSLTIGAPSQNTVQTGVIWALSATAYDAAGNIVSQNDVTVNWQASGGGAVTWVGPGEFKVAKTGSVTISIPSITTSAGKTVLVTSNAISMTLVGSSTDNPAGLVVTPSSNTLTVGASQPLTAVYTNSSGTQQLVTTCIWGDSNTQSVQMKATSNGATVTADSPGSTTISCSYTPSGGQKTTAQATVDVVYPTRIVTVIPENSPIGLQAVLKVVGDQYTIEQWLSN